MGKKLWEGKMWALKYKDGDLVCVRGKVWLFGSKKQAADERFPEEESVIPVRVTVELDE